MMLPRSFAAVVSWLIRAFGLGAWLIVALRAADEPKRKYDLRAADVATALREFSATSGREILFAADAVRGVRTSPVRGEHTAFDALMLMLAGTNLYALQDARSGALAVRRRPLTKPSPPPRPVAPSTSEAKSSVDPPAMNKPSKKLSALLSAWLAAAAQSAEPVVDERVPRRSC